MALYYRATLHWFRDVLEKEAEAWLVLVAFQDGFLTVLRCNLVRISTSCDFGGILSFYRCLLYVAVVLKLDRVIRLVEVLRVT